MSAELVERFYAAFDRRDGQAMAAAYAPDGHFRDPVFGDLTGAEAGAMWRMLTRTARDLKVELAEHDAGRCEPGRCGADPAGSTQGSRLVPERGHGVLGL